MTFRVRVSNPIWQTGYPFLDANLKTCYYSETCQLEKTTFYSIYSTYPVLVLYCIIQLEKTRCSVYSLVQSWRISLHTGYWRKYCIATLFVKGESDKSERIRLVDSIVSLSFSVCTSITIQLVRNAVNTVCLPHALKEKE